ncbi:unnamed protein product [Candidula unifasciata]|uniref:Uncharacterized protein n=1 Tax=Candidula unifasciata TaxID=100452 RepID=A0A8S3ZH64_9EUPU|nr:unnamed protein product [Candidula unifasciata]
MGSAVAKPLIRRRGWEKTKDVAVNTPNWNVDENVNDNCQPSVGCLRDSPAGVNKISHLINGLQAANEPFTSSPESISSSTLNEIIVTTPVNTPCRTGGPSPRSMSVIRGLSFLDSCFMSSICIPTYRTASPEEPLQPRNTPLRRNPDLEQDTPSETSSTSQSCRSPRTDTSTETNVQLVEVADNASSPEGNDPAASKTQATGLSPDQIGNIRKQLYTEGLNPAEREGGVAFFIPVTEDGMQPLTDGATVAERLTKTKKASLNYEERMILANINRQTQLFKRKQFAVRDIRNVRGAASTTDMTDRMKQFDQENVDFDAFLNNFANDDLDTDEPYTRKTFGSRSLGATDTTGRNINRECDMFLAGDDSS